MLNIAMGALVILFYSLTILTFEHIHPTLAGDHPLG
jgi:hypothetical protein